MGETRHVGLMLVPATGEKRPTSGDPACNRSERMAVVKQERLVSSR